MYESLLKSNFVGLSNFYKTPSYENEKSNVNWCISQVEPLFKMWKESDLATTKSRVGAIVKVWAKKREL